jgi:hypothetical protein
MEYVNDAASQQFNIVECNGPTTIQLNKFLPKIKKTEFVDSLLRMFNLYYTIDDKTRVVTLYTRDQFFQFNAESIVDITKRVDLDSSGKNPMWMPGQLRPCSSTWPTLLTAEWVDKPKPDEEE